MCRVVARGSLSLVEFAEKVRGRVTLCARGVARGWSKLVEVGRGWSRLAELGWAGVVVSDAGCAGCAGWGGMLADVGRIWSSLVEEV